MPRGDVFSYVMCVVWRAFALWAWGLLMADFAHGTARPPDVPVWPLLGASFLVAFAFTNTAEEENHAKG